MAFLRTTASAVLGTKLCKQSLRPLTTTRIFTQPTPTPIKPNFTSSIRQYSTPSSSTTSKLYDFHQIKALSSQLSPSRILIDVREPHEYDSGNIPTSINIPIKSSPEALFLPEEEFSEKFGFEKPAKDAEVVFYCKSGVRSSAAAQLAAQSGYEKVGEYKGSWMDWEKNGGESAK